MCLRDPAEPPLDQTSPEVAPGDDLRCREALPRGRVAWQLCPQRRAELVGVEIQNRKLVQSPRRQEAPVASTSGYRQLPELAQAVRLGRNAAETVGNAGRVVLARVVANACFGENVVRPGSAAVDREGRCAIRDRRSTRHVLDRLGGTRDVGAELVRRLVVDACVGVAVRGGLVSPPDDLRDEVAMLRDGHPEQEEGRACPELVEQVEQSGGLPLERGVRPVPVGEAEPPVHELVPVLEVDREQESRPLHDSRL